MPPYIHVRQEHEWYCFLACMQSFLEENGTKLTQDEIRGKAADIFGANPNDLGAFSAENFPRIEKAFKLKATLIDKPTWKPPAESCFALVKWAGNPASPHWVRVLEVVGTKVHLMNPGTAAFPDEVEVSDFNSWALHFHVLKISP